MSNKVGIVYDERMCGHFEEGHVESPERITCIFNKLLEDGVVRRCVMLKARHATDEEILSVHAAQWLETTKKLAQLEDEEALQEHAEEFNSIYLNSKSLDCALLSAGSTVELVKRVCDGSLRRGMAVVRPPGHHAECHTAMGFCFFNNVAMAAKIAVEKCGVSRVAIVDWDVHHGNGTQNMFYNSNHVLYFSVHRYDHGTFYPGTKAGGPHMVGEGEGVGHNVNVAWNEKRMGDEHYSLCFQHVLLPILSDYNPELILVSAGFDAAKGDPLGRCEITPHGYYTLLSMLKRFANGKIVVVLEGGYNLDSISQSYAACAKALLGDPWPHSPAPALSPFPSFFPLPSSARLFSSSAVSAVPASEQEKVESVYARRFNSCIRSILSTLAEHSAFWPSLVPYQFLQNEIAALRNSEKRLRQEVLQLRVEIVE